MHRRLSASVMCAAAVSLTGGRDRRSSRPGADSARDRSDVRANCVAGLPGRSRRVARSTTGMEDGCDSHFSRRRRETPMGPSGTAGRSLISQARLGVEGAS